MTEKILVVDENQGIQFSVAEAIKKNHEVDCTTSPEEALVMAKKGNYSLIILNGKLPGISGIEIIKRLKELDPTVSILVMTAYGSKGLAVQTIQEKSYCLFFKPIKQEELLIVLSRAMEKRQFQPEVDKLREAFKQKYKFGDIIGSSGPMQEVFALVKKVASTDASVIICGESGAGKELIAHAIHTHSPRNNKPFVKLNCVAIPEGLLESELFGQEKGSFTGAISQKAGKFELANGGTIFLDEIGDMTLPTQAKILRVLQEKEFERVRGTKTIKVDVRVIAATNKNLQKAVEEKTFREDLFFRLNVVPIYLPPLRKRKSDIPLLVEHFLKGAREKVKKPVLGISREAMKLLTEYPWPGNVRELENCIERAAVISKGSLIEKDCLPLCITTQEVIKPTPFETNGSLDKALANIEKKLILEALAETEGVQVKAAKLLGIAERSLWYRIKKYDIKI